ncbi:Thiol-disulfide oxidoreductase ResA [Posidoniimonas polymericola]|uniref:Thiol-disulfide oxidoreductase ResA n=1 Tax=Posidoniimonas polymericola TaxID=2528002 RepID=A0A5C5YM64_9BACT|nr:TlpA disulfide reductase family protein [Posidoniimonas polymericola]TWT75897.1 Thiol-disulfide oxidoreductase ResA [Posidoniimonas polymericola]
MRLPPCLAIACLLPIGLSFAADETAAPSPSGLTVTVVDSAGSPAAGAKLGPSAAWNRSDEVVLFGIASREPLVADEQGQIVIPAAEFATLVDSRDGTAIVLSGDCKEGLLLVLPPDSTAEAIGVQLKPLRQVEVTVTSQELASLNQELGATMCYAFAGDARPFLSIAGEGPNKLMLPPGEYRLQAYGSKLVEKQEAELTVTPGDADLEVTIDLPASKLAQLIGKPAPPLEQVAAWKGEPITLDELQGKVVLLDFWGYWCGPCIDAMPSLFELHDELADQGLVIIAVHDDLTAGENGVDTLAKLDEKLAPIVQQEWAGRDFPFRVALDGDAPPTSDATGPDRGVITAEYDIRAWPTAIAIDRQGRVVGSMGYHTEEQRQAIRDLLAE